MAQSGATDPSAAADAMIAPIEALTASTQRIRAALNDIVFGQARVIDEILIALLAGGHVLLVGVPGLAKTLLAHSFGTVLGLYDKRVQFTPDLMPADILGSEVLEERDNGRRSFRFLKGPIFCQILLADEINRASPRTQSALLQAMQESKIAIGGHSYDLPRPFHVIATQNPFDHHGTYPLPEAQLDRFLMQIAITYPDLEAERRMVIATTGAQDFSLTAVMNAAQLVAAQHLIRHLPVGDRVMTAIVSLVRQARPESSSVPDIARHIAWGPGPRAGQALMLAIRARAVMDGRLSPAIEDVLALAEPILRHRMALTFQAQADGVSTDQIIRRLCDLVL